VDTWNALGIFLLGSGAGALLAAIFYSAQIRRLKELARAAVTKSYMAEAQNAVNGSDILKSA